MSREPSKEVEASACRPQEIDYSPRWMHVLHMRGLIPGVTIPSSRSGSRDDRLTNYSLVRTFLSCRAGTGTYFRVGLENVIRCAGVDCLLVRRKKNATILFSWRTEGATLHV